jgi:hypothetical protein
MLVTDNNKHKLFTIIKEMNFSTFFHFSLTLFLIILLVIRSKSTKHHKKKVQKIYIFMVLKTHFLRRPLDHHAIHKHK